jgi:predicted lipoprotein with Yx(FWY)xxD motif
MTGTGSGESSPPVGGGAPIASVAPTGQARASMLAGTVSLGMSSSGTLGTYLSGPTGNTLYTHAGDSATASTCTGACATAWPPLTVPASAQASAGPEVTGTIATLLRTDGTIQVTYDGLPLYYWKVDTKPGDTSGEGVNGFVVATLGGPAPVPSATIKPGY